jgi:hypothetical protein
LIRNKKGVVMAIDGRESNVYDVVHTLTKGRPYIFVIMSFNAQQKELYKSVARIAENQFNLACIRADHVPSSGLDLLAKIHMLISRAEIIVAEISELNPNVFYEIGYAVGIQKLPLLLIEEGKPVPTDLKGLEHIPYKNTMDGLKGFKKLFLENLKFRLNTDVALLRDLLEAPVPHQSYIVTSPKYPGKHSRILGQVYDTRTFGDHLGILGLISAFGAMWGEKRGIELISAQHSPPDLLDRDINLYFIGSRKVNPESGKMLKKIQNGKRLKWAFDPLPGEKENGDWTNMLYRIDGNNREQICGEVEQRGKKMERIWTSDYGIIVRAPHPKYPGRIILIIAGAHSLGTGAACVASTRSCYIKKICTKLPSKVLEDKKSCFWVLVKGNVDRKDFLLNEDDIQIEEAGIY